MTILETLHAMLISHDLGARSKAVAEGPQRYDLHRVLPRSQGASYERGILPGGKRLVDSQTCRNRRIHLTAPDRHHEWVISKLEKRLEWCLANGGQHLAGGIRAAIDLLTQDGKLPPEDSLHESLGVGFLGERDAWLM